MYQFQMVIWEFQISVTAQIFISMTFEGLIWTRVVPRHTSIPPY